MATALQDVLQSKTPPVWLDFFDYGAALLANGTVPWLDQAQFSAFHGKVQALLRSGVVCLPVERVAHALLVAHPEIREEMRAKSRTSYPLRRLLEQAVLRDTVSGLLSPLRAANAGLPLVLSVPSPRRWLALAYAQAHDKPLDPVVAGNSDEIGGAAMFLADFLGAFSESGVDAVLLTEGTGTVAPDEAQIACYGPVLNKAHHYRWDVGLFLPDAQGAIARGNLDFVIAPDLPDGTPGGRALPAAFWEGQPPRPLPTQQFHYATIPVDAVPETVLQCLASLN